MDDFQLISQVQQFEFLYDKCQQDYKDSEKNNNTWKLIAELLGSFSK